MLNLIVTPRSHNANGERYTKRIVKYLKSMQVEYAVYFSQTIDSIAENMNHLRSVGESEFVVIGDDVVLNAVLSCVKDVTKVKIGIVPTSRKDDFASYLGISSNPIQAIKDILSKDIKNIDLMIVNDMIVLNSVVIGANVEIHHQFNQYRMKNFITKKFATLKYSGKFSGVELSLEGKGKTKKEVFFDLNIANGGFSKGQIISPLSNLQDGLFNVNYVTMSTKSDNKKHIKMLKTGRHIYNKNTQQLWLENLRIKNVDKRIKALVDGKVCTFEELNISILKDALKIYKSN